jgi:YfiH family protein
MKTVSSKLLASHKNILHAFTTRLDGISSYGNNLAYHVKDDPKNVDKNHKKLSTFLEYPIKRLVYMDQVHGDKIIDIDKDYNYDTTPTCDALVTNEKETPLMVMVADCNPILIYDKNKEVIAAVHAGRAGIFSNILSKTIKKMQLTYSCEPKDIIISLGPSIHQCCYEVGSEIKEEANKLGYEYAIKTVEGSHFLDLISIAHQQLKELGIKIKNIETSKYCTSCNTDTFYSYRAEKNSCGRFAGVIMLK